MGLNTLCDQLACLHIGGLNIYSAHTKLLVAEATFIVRRHVMLD